MEKNLSFCFCFTLQDKVDEYLAMARTQISSIVEQ